MRWSGAVLAISTSMVVACGGVTWSATDGGQTDGGQMDGGENDGGHADGGIIDGGQSDAGETDAGAVSDEFIVKVVSDFVESPVAGARVQLDDGPWLTTDTDGVIKAPLPPPTRVTIHATAVSEEVKFRSDDVVVVNKPTNPLVVSVNAGAPRKTNATVAIAGRTSSTSRIRVFGRSLGSTTAEADGTYRLEEWWRGAETVSNTIFALEIEGTSYPMRLTSFGSVDVTLTSGIDSSVAIELQPVPPLTVTATASPPDGGTLIGAVVAAQAAGWGSDLDIVDAGTSMTLTVPDSSGRTFETWITVIADSPDPAGDSRHRRRVDGPVTHLVFAPPEAPVVLSHEPDQVVPADMLFRWTDVGGGHGEYWMGMDCSWTEGTTTRRIWYRRVETEVAEARLPVIPDLQLGSGARCAWRLSWWGVQTDTEWVVAWAPHHHVTIE